MRLSLSLTLPVLVLVLFFLLVTEAISHGDAEWIQNGEYKSPTEPGISCCGVYDCDELDWSQVKYIPSTAMYAVQWRGNTLTYPESKVIRESKNGNPWACSPNNTKIRCLFIPPPGV